MRFEIFDRQRILGVFTRQGGVGPAPWASLNTGGMSGDERYFIETGSVSCITAGRAVNSIFDVWQVHSAE